MKLIKRDQFIWDFKRNGKMPSCFDSVSTKDHVVVHNQIGNAMPDKNKHKVYYVSLFPDFLDYELVDKELYNEIKIKHIGKNGAGCFMEKPLTINEYLAQFSDKKFRQIINKSIKSLESSFNITYEYNYGSISREKYDYLIEALRDNIKKRFYEKNTESFFLKEWEINTRNLFSLINKKEASLFVIYANGKPINISSNYHINDTILFSEANSYDINFSKFGLGHIGNYTILKWCLENGYKFLDLGIEVFANKKKWCNTFYDFEYQIFYRKDSLIAKAIANFEVWKISIKNSIKRKRFYKLLAKRNKKPRNNGDSEKSHSKIKQLSLEEYNQLKNNPNTIIDMEAPKNECLKRLLCNFLFDKNEHVDNTLVFEINNGKEYLIQGKNNYAKIELP